MISRSCSLMQLAKSYLHTRYIFSEAINFH